MSGAIAHMSAALTAAPPSELAQVRQRIGELTTALATEQAAERRLMATQRNGAVAQIHQLMKAHGMTPEELASELAAMARRERQARQAQDKASVS